MACDDDKVRILRGRNVWVLARTDRDGATHSDVIQTAGAFLSRALGFASPQKSRGVFDVVESPQGPEGKGRFFIGAARPVLVSAFQASSPQAALEQMPRIAGSVIARREDCDTLRAVRAEAPWFVVVEFDWRAPGTTTPWPRRAVNAFGFPFDTDTENDWLLLTAISQGQAKEPDSTLGKEVGDAAGEAIDNATRVVTWVAIVAAAGVGMWAARKLLPAKGRK